ncbi:MAG: RNA-protein complex protein Nop10 [Nanoarchaeota archaeon]|nr:RNA-protein complex protein Nop10 [Nanoarchaeota archaeon]
MNHIFICNSCGTYTMKDKCIKCGEATVRKIPPKYSSDDKYGKYRRQVKSESLKGEGLI